MNLTPNTDTPTPRTSAAILPDAHFQHNFQIVSASFTRTLEHELTAAHGVIARLKEALVEVRRQAFADESEERKIISTVTTALAMTPEAYTDRLATQDVLLAEYSKLAKERQEWALHTNDVIRALRARLTAAEQDADALAGALEPFAKFACDEPHIGEPACYNCDAKAALVAHRARKETK